MKHLVFIFVTVTLVSAQISAPIVPESGANLPAQVIGANDLIHVAVYDAPELTRTVRVGPDGYIRLPMLVRQIKAAGLMPANLETSIAEGLMSEKILKRPYVTVAVAEYHSRPISVAGAVKQPLTFQALGDVTLLEAITRAGGLSQEAGSEILVSRTTLGPDGLPSTLTQRIGVKALIEAADPDANMKLAGGEEIRVPDIGKIFIVGNVKKPGVYPVQEGSETSVLQALAVCEGLLPFASKQAYMYRREGAAGGKNEIPIELSKIMARKAPDVPMLANDILYIPDRQGRRASVAALEKILMLGTGAGGALVYAGVR
jgi:polysaccharide export outer membrane protein